MADKQDFTTGKPPESKIRKAGFQQFLSTLFGWRRKDSARGSNGGLGQSARTGDIDFVSVDLGSEERLSQALGPEQVISKGLTGKLEELFQAWLNDTTDNLREIADRRRRVDQLTYAILNDPFLSRVVSLYGDEATQADMQDRLISIETPDPRMTREMYRLLQTWGVTQTRIKTAIEQLAAYGDGFWAHKITENGVERIIPLRQLQVTDKLEFNPLHAHEKLKRINGFDAMANREQLIKRMLDDMSQNSELADMFDTKLFGYILEDDLVVPPWAVTHFRVNADGSDFYPFGRSPMLGTLAPFKLAASTITLQSIARILSFPVTLYKVKTSDSMDEARQFALVDRVREQYDNIGVFPSGGTSESYTVNTKIWIPDGLLTVETINQGGDIKFTEDIEMYQDRVAIATGIPKGYLVQEWGGFGNSAISLVEQWKPFGRSVYTLQSAFLEGLADLFRLHFAINGKFDFRTPFTLALKFPGDEMSDEKMSFRNSSMELASSVIALIRSAIGADEDEILAPDIVRDILSKYTFLDPVDIVKWTRDADRIKAQATADEFEASTGGLDMGGASDMSLDDLEGEEPDFDLDEDLSDELAPEEAPVEEKASRKKARLAEVARMKELTKRYKEVKNDLYFQVLNEHVIKDFVRQNNHIHVSRDASYAAMSDLLERVSNKKEDGVARFSEAKISDILSTIKRENSRDPSEREEK